MKDFLITLCLGWLGVHRFMQKKYITGAIWFFTLGLCGIGWAVDALIALVKVVNEKKPQTAQQTTQNPKNEQKFGGGVQPAGGLKNYVTQNNDTTRTFTKAQIEAMSKADILSLAAALGYTMQTVESHTKDKIVNDFLQQQEKQPSVDTRKWLIKTFKTEITGTFAKCDLDKSCERAEIICALKPHSKLYLEYWQYKGEPAFYVCCQGVDAGCVPANIAKTLNDVYKDCEIVVTLRGEAEYNGHDDLIQKILIEVYK